MYTHLCVTVSMFKNVSVLRRAKLAQWQASKGKTFKRPAMTAGAPPKTKVCAKPKANLQPESQPAAQRNPEPELSMEAHKPDSAADTQGAESTTHSQTPAIMETTIDLLSNSDADLPVDPQDRMDDVRKQACFSVVLKILSCTAINHVLFFSLDRSL